MKSAIEIANSARLLPITEVARNVGILPEELVPFGHDRGKVKLSILDRLASRPDGKMVIVTAITPTKAGEGKTTTSIALTQGLGKRRRKVMLCLREPSMGPVFGIKGGGTGGGYSQVMPMEDINLHFNGDSHAVTAAHSLLAAALDASIFNGNPLRIDPLSVTWPRTVDMNDRELRYSVVGLGGKAHGIPRQNEFVITAASEVMAVFALASDLKDLRRRLGRIVVASTVDGKPVTADDLKVAGAMTVIMKEAINPNLVQTLEGQPVLVHAGPFGNIAHGNNSILADRIALKLADYVITEAGFASDLGMQKFCDIVCRTGGFSRRAPRCSSPRSGRRSRTAARRSPTWARKTWRRVARGMDNLTAHIQIVRQYGLPCVVAVNSFPTEYATRSGRCSRSWRSKAGAETVVIHEGFSRGGAGAVELADAVIAACSKPSDFRLHHPQRDAGGRTDSRRSPPSSTAPPASTCRCRRRRISSASRSSGWARRWCAWRRRISRCRTIRAAEPADRLHSAGPESGAERRRRLRRGALRRHAAHAGPRQDAGLHQHRHRRRRADGGAVLGASETGLTSADGFGAGKRRLIGS